MDSDKHFIKEAAADNQFEIQASQYVEQQRQNPQVKQLAQRLVEDHQRAQQQLQQIAQGMKMELPTQLEQWQQDKLQAMQQKHGEHLEMHYTFGQVGDHTTDLLKYQYEAEHGQNAQVKQYAEQQFRSSNNICDWPSRRPSSGCLKPAPPVNAFVEILVQTASTRQATVQPVAIPIRRERPTAARTQGQIDNPASPQKA